MCLLKKINTSGTPYRDLRRKTSVCCAVPQVPEKKDVGTDVCLTVGWVHVYELKFHTFFFRKTF